MQQEVAPVQWCEVVSNEHGKWCWRSSGGCNWTQFCCGCCRLVLVGSWQDTGQTAQQVSFTTVTYNRVQPLLKDFQQINLWLPPHYTYSWIHSPCVLDFIHNFDRENSWQSTSVAYNRIQPLQINLLLPPHYTYSWIHSPCVVGFIHNFDRENS